ncbi:MAG: PIG-L family deacetylase [Clostridiales bacterium]|nr:PIG-L family deacetylase [Clostridiales bacterium]
MIKVNWQKIKPFEKKSFALPVMAILILIGIAAVIYCFFSPLKLMALKFFSALFIFTFFAFYIHIESRMLQIYMLLAIFDVGVIFAGIIPVNLVLTVFFFVLSLLLALFCVALCIISKYSNEKDTAYDFPEPDRPALFKNKSVMFFAPHEDDEINVFGGIIEHYINNKSTVRVVFSTNGDFHGLGKMRIREAMNVAKKYGVPNENFIFLGYSDSLENSEGKHMYNCPGNEELTSARGIKCTYGNSKKAPYRSHLFTRNNFLSDVKSVIENYKPDVLYCCDYDVHADHRAISLIFEEALDLILKENPFYRPEVFKGFAYSTAWDGLLDYYSQNAASTKLKIPAPYMGETNVYDWKDRVRLPVAKESLSRVMQNSKSYIAMAEYSSQTATDHANSILNADKVFWRRRTDSVLYDAKITATSGNAARLNNFKLVDSSDIKMQNELPLYGIWVPDKGDRERAILFEMPVERKISSVALYENPSDMGHIINAVVSLGSFSFNTGELKPNGAATIFEFPAVSAKAIAVKVQSFTGVCSLLKVEAYETHSSSKAQLVKICSNNGDFCYDYIINKSGREEFGVYTYPECKDVKLYISSDNDGLQAHCENSLISVNCPPGESGILKVSLAEDPEIYDEIRISNPDERERSIIELKQKYEHIVYSPAMQRDYYRGLLRRLGTYFPALNR